MLRFKCEACPVTIWAPSNPKQCGRCGGPTIPEPSDVPSVLSEKREFMREDVLSSQMDVLMSEIESYLGEK